MATSTGIGIRGLTAAAFALAFAAAPCGADVLRGGCDVRFDATSTLHDFSGTARCRPFDASLATGPDGRAVVPAIEVELPVDAMRTGNRTRDGQMRRMLESERFPVIRAAARGIEPARLRREIRSDPGVPKAVTFLLKIRDVERPVRAVVRRLAESGGTATVELDFPVSLREFGLAPPTVFGFIKVGDRVTVAATIRIEGVPPE